MDLTRTNLLCPKITRLVELIWLGQAMVDISRDVNSGVRPTEPQRQLNARSPQGQIIK